MTVLIAAIAAWSPAAAADDAAAAIREGKQLFVRQFVAGHSETGGGDGLGPLFNHVSCAACHQQGAIGGGGDIEFNVSVLSAQLAQGGVRPPQKALLSTLKKLHPAFVTSDNKITPNILLHRFGPGKLYSLFKTTFGDPDIPFALDTPDREELQRNLASQPAPLAKRRGAVRLVRVQRNTTALFGAGLIDAVPDATLYNLAADQAGEGKVSGRVPPIGTDKVGRFGWRGQQEHLHDFVLGACANELGLEVPGNPQPLNPLRPKDRPTGLDLTAEQCESLTEFIAALPPPRFAVPWSPTHRETVARGRRLFGEVGCAACHVEQVGLVAGIYSDLLLHDMGPVLADPVLAEATLVFLQQHEAEANDLPSSTTLNASIARLERRPEPPPQPPTSTQYYGGSTFQSLSLAGSLPATVKITDATTGIVNEYRVQQTSLEQEWRTPPLWGVADSAPYLHDGRAETILDAINLHRGEADAAKVQFSRLPHEDKQAVLEFLNCLKAP